MHPHALLIQRFYEAFQARDAEAMARCYHADVVFSDPAFGELRGERARDMWRMLCARATDLRVDASGITADQHEGAARWVATYSFGKQKRRVRNVIDARFSFRDGARRVDDAPAPTPSGSGLIARHTDSFSVWRWSSMALGPTGALLGWTPMVQARVRRDATRQLDKFVAARIANAPRAE